MLWRMSRPVELALLFSILSIFSSCSAATSLSDQLILYNTHKNTAGACLSDCQAAAQQVCQKSNSQPTPILPGRASVIDVNVTVGACFARFLDLKPNSTAPKSVHECQAAFAGLIGQTAGTKNQSNCNARLGGVLGNNKYGRAMSRRVYSYFPIGTIPDGFKDSLDHVPQEGVVRAPHTIFGVDQSACQGQRLSNHTGLVPFNKRTLECSPQLLLGMTTGQVLCGLSLWLVGWEPIFLGVIGGATCLGTIAASVMGMIACLGESDSPGIEPPLESNKAGDDYLLDPEQLFGNNPDGRRKRLRVRASGVQSQRRGSGATLSSWTKRATTADGTFSLLPAYCNQARLQTLAKTDQCLAAAFGKQCGMAV